MWSSLAVTRHCGVRIVPETMNISDMWTVLHGIWNNCTSVGVLVRSASGGAVHGTPSFLSSIRILAQ